MFYTIYQTTNTVNSKKYIGKHATPDPYDEYLGSGVVLTKAIEKYGRDKFTKEVLFIFNTEEEMNAKERELITSDIVLSEEYYNIALGGDGGAIVLKPEHPLYNIVCKKISEAQLARSEEMSKIVCDLHQQKRVGMYGRTQSEYQKQVTSKRLKGVPKTPEQVSKQKETLYNTFNDPNYTHPNKGKIRQKYTCKYCGKVVGGITNLRRYHNDNCKHKMEEIL